MKIAWVIDNINVTNGMVHVVIGLSNIFCEKGYSVEITSFYSKETKPYWQLNPSIQVTNLGMDWRKLSRVGKHNLLGKLMLENDSDILLTCNEWANSSSVLNKEKFRGKIVLTQHMSCDSLSPKRRMLNCLVNRFADRFVVLTKADQRFYEKYGVSNVQVIPNANYNEVNPNEEKEKSILAVGRIEHIKGFDLLIDAFSMVANKHPDWKLRILGEGSQRKKYLVKIERLGLSGQIELQGATPKVADAYASSSVYAFSSRGEGFGLSLVEAMGGGNAIVAFDLPCVGEILGPKSGIVVPCEDTKAFSEALDKMMSDKTFREECGKAALTDAEKFSKNAIGNMWTSLFNELVR